MSSLCALPAPNAGTRAFYVLILVAENKLPAVSYPGPVPVLVKLPETQAGIQSQRRGVAVYHLQVGALRSLNPGPGQQAPDQAPGVSLAAEGRVGDDVLEADEAVLQYAQPAGHRGAIDRDRGKTPGG